jgi:predicted nuclease of predicted toxin-antitoxin system
VAHLETKGHDALHASTAGLGTEDDSVILERARIDDRIVVTADLDYPRLLALLKADRPGVILFRGGSYSDAEMLALLDRVLAQSDTLELSARSPSWISTESVAAAYPSRIDPRLAGLPVAPPWRTSSGSIGSSRAIAAHCWPARKPRRPLASGDPRGQVGPRTLRPSRGMQARSLKGWLSRHSARRVPRLCAPLP